MKKDIKCRVCGASTLFFDHKLLDRDEIKVVKCKRCYLVQLSSTDHIFDGYYESDEYFGEELETKLVKEKSWNLKRVELISKNIIQHEKKIALDFGCGPGGFLDLGNGIFKKLYGFDLSERMRKWNSKNNKLILENIDNVEDINVVMLFHVLEHVKKPLEFINFIKNKFINLEILIIEVPNNNELLISKVNNIAYKNNHYSLEHLNYFNSETLRKILDMSSLKILFETQYQRYRLGNTIGWLDYGKGGYQYYFPEYNEINFHELYENFLVSRKVADTLFIIASLK